MKNDLIDISNQIEKYSGLQVQQDILHRMMKPRHLIMLTIGGAIGSGLFLSSGFVVGQVGAVGAVITYLFGALLVYLVMLSLTEMAIVIPVSGSFMSYAEKFISHRVGYSVGYCYWFTRVTATSADLVAAAVLSYTLYNGLSVFYWCIIYLAALLLVNLASVKYFAEIEFWIAATKIITIIIFLILCLIILCGGFNQHIHVMNNLYPQKSLFPHGISVLFASLTIVSFAYQGCEFVGVAIGECEKPRINAIKIIHNIAYRLVLFYVLSIAMIGTILPHDNLSASHSPFAQIFAVAGLNHATTIVCLVVILSSLSSNNSAIYVASRLLFAMSKSKMAPVFLATLNKSGVPFWGVIITIVATAICLISKFVAPERLYLFLVASSGMFGCLVWMSISVSNLGFRKFLKVHSLNYRNLPFKVNLCVPILSIILNCAILVSLMLESQQRIIITSGICIIIVLQIMYQYQYRNVSSNLVRKKDIH